MFFWHVPLCAITNDKHVFVPAFNPELNFVWKKYINFAPTSIFSVIPLASGTATPTATIYTSNNNVIIIIIIVIIIIITTFVH